MATCNLVNVLCPNGRRQKVKVSPHMTLLQLMQDVCKKQSLLNPNSYAIRHQRKILDITLTVRFANLPNNAHLELVELSEEQVNAVKKCVVALQLESGDRLVHEFNSDQSLFNILEHWRTQPGRISFADGIACIYANQEFRGLEKLKSTTLSMIGFNGGRGIIRLIQQSTSCEKDESDVMEGVGGKLIVESPKVEPAAVTPAAVPAKLSTEEMEVESRTASSVSMTSQTSDEYTMQCAETQCAEVTTDQSTSERPPLLNAANSNKQTRSIAQKSQKIKKVEKAQEVSMDVEQCEMAGHQTKAGAKAGPSNDASVADACQSTATVQVFSGVGRTLSESGPEMKKARLHSPPANQDKPQACKVSNLRNTEPGIKRGESVGEIDREMVAFRLGETNSMSSDEDISDEFFEVTIDDLRLMLKDLKNERAVETPMLTQNMRENLEKNRMDKYDKVAIRVYFPDRSVLQGFFSPAEKVDAVNDFVKEHLQNTNTNFYLYTTPPRILLDKPLMTLFEAKLVPAAVVHFGSHETQDFYLNTKLMQQIIDIAKANEKVGDQCRPSGSPSTHTTLKDKPKDTTIIDEKTETENSTSEAERPTTRENIPKNSNKTAKPKWFKLGK